MRHFLLCWLCIMILASCGNPPVAEPTTTPASIYPVPTAEAISGRTTSYPGPSATTDAQLSGLFFYIAEPVRVTDSQLSGGGPPQAPILVVNLSKDNALLAEAVVDDNGRFLVPLREVAAGDTVAIIFNDRVASMYTREQLQNFSIATLPSGELIMSSVIVAP